MASSSKSGSSPRVPAALVEKHRNVWHGFTQAIVIGSVSVAAVLVLMFIFLWLV